MYLRSETDPCFGLKSALFIPIFLIKVEPFCWCILIYMDETVKVALFFAFMAGGGLGFYLAKILL